MGGKTAKITGVRTKTPANRKTAILVAGMHRSGTSALTRTLGLLGCALPKNLLPANEANQLGYWESPAVTELNDDILAASGVKWNDWGVLAQQSYLSRSLAKYRRRARAILETEFGGSHIFVVKDPRLCRVLGFWIDAVQEFGATPAMVVPIRNPLDVAASMEARDGTNPSIAFLLWLRYNLDAEIASRQINRSYARFNDLLEDWRTVMRRVSDELEIDWPQPLDIVGEEVDRFLSAEHCHHSSDETESGKDPNFTPWVKTSFDIFGRWASGRIRKSDIENLDRIRAGLDETTTAFCPAITAGQRAENRRRQLRAELANAEARVDELKITVTSSLAEVDAARKQSDSLRETVAARDSEVVRLREKTENLESTLSARSKELSAAFARIDDLSSLLDKLSGELTAAQTHIGDLENVANSRDAELARIQETLTGLEKTAKTSDRRVAQLRASEEELETALRARLDELSAARLHNIHLEQKLSQLRVDLTHASDRIANLEASVEVRDHKLTDMQTTSTEMERIVDARDREISRVEGRLERTRSDLAARNAELSRTEERIKELEEVVFARGEELSALTTQITDLHAELGQHRSRKRLLESSVGTLAREIRAMRKSASWRLTGPLRVISDRIRRRQRGTHPSGRQSAAGLIYSQDSSKHSPGGGMAGESGNREWAGDREQMVVEAKAAADSGDWLTAIACWQRILHDFEDRSPDSYAELSHAYRGCGEIEAAEETVNEGLRIDPGSLSLAIEYAEIATARRNWREAVERWNAVQSQIAEPTPGVYAALSRAYRGCGDFASAECAVDLGRRIAPAYLPFATERAQIASAIGDWPEAVRRWEMVLSNSEGQVPGVYAALCRAHRACGNLEAAEKVVREGRTKSPYSRSLSTEHAQNAMARKDWHEAIRRWEALLREFADPTPGIYAALSRAYRGTGDFDSAQTAVDTGLSLDNNYPPLATELAEIAMAREEWSEAIDRWRKIVFSPDHRCSRSILDRIATLCFGLFDGDQIDRALEFVRELKSFCGEKRLILALEGIAYLRAARIEEARDHWSSFWQRGLDDESFASEPNLPIPERCPDNAVFPEATPQTENFRYGEIGSRFCVYTSLIGDYDELCTPLYRPPGLDFICFSDRPRDVPGWDVRIVKSPMNRPVLESRKLKILPYELLDEYDCSLYIDASVLFLGDPLVLFHHWLNGRAFVGWRHAVRSDLFEECEAILARLKHDAGPIVSQYDLYLKEGVPRFSGLIEAGFLWRDHRDEETRQLMSSWWEHLSEYSSGRDQPGLAYCMWKTGVHPEVMPSFLGTVHSNDFMVVRPHSMTCVALERSLLDRSTDLRRQSRGTEQTTVPGERSPDVTHRTKCVTWVYSTQFQAVASTLMRGYQLSEIARRHFNDRLKVDCIEESALDSQENATLILTKGFLKNVPMRELEAAKEAGNHIWVDYVDDPPRPELHEVIDGYVASSIQQFLHYSELYPDRMVQLVTHHTDPRIGGIRGPVDYCNIGYFGEIVNARYREELQGLIDFCLVYTKVAGDSWIDRLRHCNVHYAVRDQQELDGFKPFLKGFTAARCESNIIVPLDEGDARYYLGSGYPYILKDTDLKSVLEMIDFVHESFGGPEWNHGLELMESVRRRCSPTQIAAELDELVEKSF